MDKDAELDAVDKDVHARSGQDRRMPNDRRRSTNPLLELNARREGIIDRRQRERREGENRADGWIRRWFGRRRPLKAN